MSLLRAPTESLRRTIKDDLIANQSGQVSSVPRQLYLQLYLPNVVPASHGEEVLDAVAHPECIKRLFNS